MSAVVCVSRTFVAAGVVLLAACANPEPRVVAVAVPVDRVILLPGSEGAADSIVVTQGNAQAVLDKPYTSARAGTSGNLQVDDVDPAAVKRDFAAVFEALPPASTSFLVYFVSAQEELTEDSRKAIVPVLKEMASRPAPEITVIGHTDSTGTDRINDALSLKRAERVKEMLVQRGVAAERITTVGRGSRELLPGMQGTSERNRRVEISVR